MHRVLHVGVLRQLMMFIRDSYLFGLIRIALSLLRIVLRIKTARPVYPQEVSAGEKLLAKVMQWLMLVLGLLLMLSGYALATADGSPALLPWGSWLVQVLPDDSLSLDLGLLLHKSFLIAFCCCLFLHVVGFVRHQVQDNLFYKRIV